MKELTPEQQQVVDKAANAYSSQYMVHPGDEVVDAIGMAFSKGCEFVLSTPSLYMGYMEEFAEWIRTFEALERQNGQWVIESQLSDKDIVKAFIEHKNKKEDGNARNR